MPGTWDSETCQALLTQVVAIADVRLNTAQWEQVAQILTPDGSFSASACSQKFYKLKKESESLLAGAGKSTAPATPTAKKTRTPKSTGTGKSKGKRTKADMLAEDDEAAEADDGTPIKKQPRVKKQAKEETKIEIDNEVTKEEEDDEVTVDGENVITVD